jgi:hypothetical protein
MACGVTSASFLPDEQLIEHRCATSTDQMPPMPSQQAENAGSKTVYHDEDGDLRLLVGPDEIAHVVCSRTLARVSPVWKIMLYGPMRESRPESGDWVVKLPEDDEAALGLLLSTAHSAWDTLPKRLSPNELYNVCRLTDKYDNLKLLIQQATFATRNLCSIRVQA